MWHCVRTVPQIAQIAMLPSSTNKSNPPFQRDLVDPTAVFLKHNSVPDDPLHSQTQLPRSSVKQVYFYLPPFLCLFLYLSDEEENCLAQG